MYQRQFGLDTELIMVLFFYLPTWSQLYGVSYCLSNLSNSCGIVFRHNLRFKHCPQFQDWQAPSSLVVKTTHHKDKAKAKIYSFKSKIKAKASDFKDKTKAKASDLKAKAKAKASDLKAKAKAKASDFKAKAKAKASDAKAKAKASFFKAKAKT